MSDFNFSKGKGKGKGKFAKFISGKGFYVALALCIVGAGAAAWVAADRTLSGINQNNSNVISGQSFMQDPQSSQDVGQNATDVPVKPGSSSSSSAPSTSSSSSAPSSKPNDQSSLPTQQAPSQTLAFSLPIDSAEIVANFSGGKLVKNTTLNEWRTHDGIDIKAEKGVSVMACADGVVKTVRQDALWGTVIEIDHDGGLTSIYCGLSKDVKVKAGDQVQVKDQIGSVDQVTVELNTPSHMHFAMKKDGQYVDPLKTMGKA